MKKIIISAFVILGSVINVNAQKAELKQIIKNEKIRDFTVSIYGTSNDSKIILMKNNKNHKEFLFNSEIFMNNPKSEKNIENYMYFEDYNFDGKDEIVIKDIICDYIFDYENGQPVNWFSGKFPYEEKEGIGTNTGLCGDGNMISHRTEYEFNKKEKIIKLRLSGGALNGEEETYKWIDKDDKNASEEERGKYKLIERKQWDLW